MAIDSVGSSANGRHCRFYQIGNRGFKYFYSFDRCQDSFAIQNELSQHKIAPELYSDIFSVRDGFAFETQIVDRPFSHFGNVVSKWPDHVVDDFQSVREEICRLGYVDPDDANFNYGYARHRPVVMDCGDIQYNPKRAEKRLEIWAGLDTERERLSRRWMSDEQEFVSACKRKRDSYSY